jgi:formiminotetrahydrofolate cyclodeaminase
VEHEYMSRTLGELLEELARDTPVPGAGPAAALVVAASAALAAMAARSSRESWSGAGAAVAQADSLRERALRLAAQDAAAVEAYIAARSPGDEPSETRDFRLGRALDDAADVPLAICAAACDVALLAADVAAWCVVDERADAAAAASLALGAARAAALLVEVNLSAGTDDERVRQAQSYVRAARGAANASAPSG